jgi:protein-S-isoprenylcysteine O-methyltransferase Ste14
MVEGHKRHNHEHRKDLAGEYRWGDTGQIILLIVFIIGMISDLFIYKISNPWQSLIAWYFRIILFLPFIVTAWYFAQKGHKKVFQEKRNNLVVIKTDVFGIIRHPIYFSSLMIYLGFVILSLSMVALVVFIIGIIFYYYLCRYEEQILIEKLGNNYLEYKKKTPMLIPFIKIKKKLILVIMTPICFYL